MLAINNLLRCMLSEVVRSHSQKLMQPLAQVLRQYYSKEYALAILSGNYRAEEEYDRMLEPVRRALRESQWAKLELY